MKTCDNCSLCFKDFSTGQQECKCDDITEQELQQHFTNEKENCLHWIEQKEEIDL